MLAWLVTGTLGSPNVTTVTPSEQAGATSAKRPATIPTQRSGQTLRLLVLGTSDDAAAFRARAAEAGVELAQRFSVRVTHVVVEAGVGDDDARVVRARGAGLPVLGLLDGARLVEETMTGAGRAGAQAEDGVAEGFEEGAGEGVRERPREGVEEGAGKRIRGLGETGSAADVGAGAGAGGEASEEAGSERGPERLAARTADRGVERDEDGTGVEDGDSEDEDAAALIRPRAEAAPESSDGGPSDVFSGSAFEAMLQFPPLPTDALEGGGEGVEGIGNGTDASGAGADVRVGAGPGVGVGARADVDASVGVDAGAGEEATVGGVADERPSVLMDAVAAACAAAEAEAETEAETEAAGAGAAAAGDELEAADERVDVVELLGAAEDGDGEATALGRAASVAWALAPLVSLGLLTPVAIGYAAYRLRSRRLAAATACYTVAIVAAFAVSAALPVHTRAQSIIDDLMTTCLAVVWLGGTAHALMLRRRVFGLFE